VAVILISILFFVTITCFLYLVGVKFWVSPQTMVDRVMGEAKAGQVKHPSLAFHDLLEKLGSYVPSSPADMSLAQQRLFRAGYRSARSLQVFLGVKLIAAIGFPVFAWIGCTSAGLSTERTIVFAVASAGLGFVGTNEVLNFLIKRRKNRIARALPNALDLLVVCVESGLALDQAIVQVSRELQGGYPELSGELAITNLEMRHGKRRADALRDLADRTDIDDMKKLVSTLVQADRFGTSIAKTLRTHSDFMRTIFRQRAEEQAAKIGIKLVFPIFFCILPSLFVVTVGPVIVRIFVELIPMMNG
jgi:tight adherence protein C